MQVIILCGGAGTRMGSLSGSTPAENVPKPLLPIQGIPICFRIIKHYRKYGFKEFIICTGSRTDFFKDRFADASEEERKYLGAADIKIIDTGSETNTGGRIKKVSDYIDGDFCMTYGDGLSSVNLEKLLHYHQSHQCLATMTVIRPRFNLGIAHIDDSGNILSFAEKPKLNAWANGGFYAFKKEALDYIEDNSILETESLPQLASLKQLKAYYHFGFWRCMDTPKDYYELNRIYNRLRR